MADKATTRNRATDKNDDRPHDMVPDLMGVKSRVSWAAILAGAVIALACFYAFSFFFSAIGITMTDAGVRDRTIGYGALAAAIFSIVASLFIGGWVASQMTVGENRQEAVIYGILTWAAFTAVSMWMVAAGVRAGYFAAISSSAIVQNNERVPTWEQAALQAGFTQDQVTLRQGTTSMFGYAAWIALVGLLLSMASSIGGAMVGRGVAFHLYPVRVRDDRSQIVVPANP